MASILQITSTPVLPGYVNSPTSIKEPKAGAAGDQMDAVFQQFVGETFYQMMLKSLHSMHDKPAYLHGGQGETLFQSQLDQEMASRLAKNDIGTLSQDLYQTFQAQLQNPT